MNVTLEMHNSNLEKVNGLLTDEKQCAVTIAPENTEIQMILDEQKKKTREAFKVLIVGAFNAGKTSMINALAGRENFLPTGDLPETGVITELIYGEQYRITLYPKEGSGNAEPLVLIDPAADVFKKYCSIDNKANMTGELTSNMQYERVVVECDIPLLKEGIMLIDTVGMNDPWGNDYITERYFPKSDAVIYLMDSNHIYTAEDKRLLTRINDFGFRDLIIVYTKFGEVMHRNRRKPQSVMDEFCEIARQQAANHTDIGDAGIHFIDSLDALDGKLSGDRDMVVRSGFDGFEKFYTRYLVENKGRMKIQTLNNSMQRLCEELTSMADKIRLSATTDIGVLNTRIAAANQELDIAEQNMLASVAHFKDAVQKARPLLEASIENHVAQLANKVDLEDYELKNRLPRGMTKFIPGRDGKMAEAIQQECQNELEQRMARANKDWMMTEMSNMLQSVITSSLETIGSELMDFYVQMDEVDAKLTGNYRKEKNKKTITDVVAGVAFTALTGDPFTGSLALTHGTGAMGRAIAGNIAVNTAVMVALGMGVPVSIPLVLAADIATHIIAILATNNEKRETKLKADIMAGFRKAYSEAATSQQTTTAGMIRACDDIIVNAGERIKAQLQMELDKKRAEIGAMCEVAQKGVGEKNLLIKRNQDAMKTLDEICREGNQIAAQYN
ncbi:MAG: dynamin family protein [Clostridia bacterium]|nr:dynamin family protein [Clostridia bacterium]